MTITGGTALSQGRDRPDAEGRRDVRRRGPQAARDRRGPQPADNLVYQVDKALEEYGDKVPAERARGGAEANDDVKEALKGEDVDRIKSGDRVAQQAFQRIGQAMYSQQQAAGGGRSRRRPGAAGGPRGPGGVDSRRRGRRRGRDRGRGGAS